MVAQPIGAAGGRTDNPSEPQHGRNVSGIIVCNYAEEQGTRNRSLFAIGPLIF